MEEICKGIINLNKAAEKKWDLVIVGGGVAGASAARVAAAAGVKTIIVERMAPNDIGKKICGDAVSHYHFEAIGIDPPKEDAFEGEFKGVRIFSPDEKTSYLVSGRGYALNRQRFGQRLIREAVDLGASVLAETWVFRPLLEDGDVVGVIGRDKRGLDRPIRAKIVVDASGFRGVIRKAVSTRLGVEDKFSPSDLEFCYREIRQLKYPLDEFENADIHLNMDISPGGYWWFFPKNEGRTVNIGLGLQMSSGKHPVRRFNEYLARLPILKGSSVLDAGPGIVPTRRPIHTMVGDGVVIIGDAAAMANPLHGGGIGQAMFSGVVSGRVVAEALSEGEVARLGLWEINLELMREFGNRNAKLDIFRLFLQRLTNKDINFGMAKRIVDEEDLRRVELGRKYRGDLTFPEKVERILRGLKKPSLLRKIVHANSEMKMVGELYENYPTDPEELTKWVRNVDKVFKDFERSL